MNPKIKRFLDDYPDITLVGLAWALLWRFWLLVYGGFFLACFVIGFVLGLVGAIVS
jgi:hypothetical protein